MMGGRKLLKFRKLRIKSSIGRKSIEHQFLTSTFLHKLGNSYGRDGFKTHHIDNLRRLVAIKKVYPPKKNYTIMKKKQTKQILRIVFIITSISSLYFVPWILGLDIIIT